MRPIPERHGGKRAGAGRKPTIKPLEPLVPIEVAAAAGRVVEAIVAKARKLPTPSCAVDMLPLAFETLQDVMANSPFPAPRVSAAKLVIDYAMAEIKNLAVVQEKPAPIIVKEAQGVPVIPVIDSWTSVLN
jgi:hypothetical protein